MTTTTYFSSEKATPGREDSPSSPISCAFEHEFEKFVGQHNRQTSLNDVKTCSNLGIMQPLEQLHTANLALGIRLEHMFEKVFRHWGKFVARNPWTVIISSIVVSLYLAAGVFTHFQVTTDPVDLWVPAGSQARSDMELFNKKFWKFYRIEQVIVEPKYKVPFVPGSSASGLTKKEFGPVFNHTFLLEVFDLYEQILNVSARHVDSNNIATQVGLEDICYKPLNGFCASQSIFSYFHDNRTKLESGQYLETIQNCVE